MRDLIRRRAIKLLFLGVKGQGAKEKGKGLRLRARSFALDHFWLTDSGAYEGGKLDCIYGIVTV